MGKQDSLMNSSSQGATFVHIAIGGILHAVAPQLPIPLLRRAGLRVSWPPVPRYIIAPTAATAQQVPPTKFCGVAGARAVLIHTGLTLPANERAVRSTFRWQL